MKYLLSLTLMLFAFGITQAQTDKSKGELTVKSSVVCNMCKDTIEKALAFESGVKSVKVDVDANEVYVKYNPKKTSDEAIKQAITALGYVADDMKPTEEAYNNLHECCKAELGKH